MLNHPDCLLQFLGVPADCPLVPLPGELEPKWFELEPKLFELVHKMLSIRPTCRA